MVDILVFGAHPDDIELGCGGILACMAAQKKSIVMVDLTRGEKGTHGSPEIRQREGEEAARLIGAERVCLDFQDTCVSDTEEGRLKLVKVIRQYKPRLVLASMWKGEQTHPDHLACGLMARYACRYARFSKILPELPSHRVDGILHYLSPTQDHYADFLFDITAQAETWKQMIACHKSQLSTINYLDLATKNAAKMGALIGKPFAQGLAKGNPIEVHDLMLISKGTLEL